MEIIVTLKQPGKVWPVVRGIFAAFGFGVVLGMGFAAAVDKGPAVKPLIEAGAEGRRAVNPLADAPIVVDPFANAPIVEPIPDTVAGPVNPSACEPLPNTAIGLDGPPSLKAE